MENDLLEFIAVNGANTEENVYLTDNNPEVLIDAMSKTTRSVYILGSSKLVTHIVRFSCEVGRRAVPLTDVKFCCGVPDQKLGCHQLFSQPKVGQVSCDGIFFDYVFNQYTGANFTLSFNPITNHTFAYNRQIYCEVKDSEATIQSNVIDLRDAIYYAIQLGVTAGNTVERLETAVISPQDFPLKFACGNFAEKIKLWPSWMAAVWQRYLSPFEWAFCPIKEPLTPFGCAKDRMSISVGESITTMDGTLFLLSDKLLINYPNSAFVCIKRGTTEPIIVYASEFTSQATPRITKGFSVDSNAEPSLHDSFEALSPTSLDYQFVDGTVLSDFNLLAFYRVPRDAENVKFAWYRDGKKLSDRESDKYSFRLPDRVERSFAGTYELRVEQNSQVQLTFTFVITVVGPPKFHDADCVEDLFYALEGSDRRFLCLLSSPDESTNFKVGINGFEAQTTEQLKNILASTLQLQSLPISQLDINFWRVDAKGTNGVVVDVRGLKVDQNFRLSIKAVNAYGQSQVAGTLRVVPKPSLVIAPSKASCSIDCNDEPFEVQCVASDAVTRQWNNLNIISLQGWVIDRSYTMDEVLADAGLAKYFAYDPNDTSTLRVSPYMPFSEIVKTTDLPRSTTTWMPSQSSTQAPRETLQDALNARLPRPSSTLLIECRFQLFVDNPRAKFDAHTITGDAGVATAMRQRRRRQAVDEQRKIYDSYNEPNKDLHDTFTATRTLSELVKPLAISFAWIAAVVIAVIFIVIVIIVGVWLCTRNRGETYKLSKKEYKLGNDPLRELKEKETFQAYERPEEPPSLASAIDEPDLDVSSDDDGELEAYKIDPTRSKLLASPRTFNEDASFIGQYNTPSRGAVNGISAYRDHHTAV